MLDDAKQLYGACEFPRRLCLLLQRGLLQLLGCISHRILLLRQLGLGRGSPIDLSRLLRGIGGTAVRLGNVRLFFLQAGNLILGLLNVLSMGLAPEIQTDGRKNSPPRFCWPDSSSIQ